MSSPTPETLQELHRVREHIAQEQTGLSNRERVERTRREVDALLKGWGFTFKQSLASSKTSPR